MLGGKWQSFYKANKVNSWEEEINLLGGGEIWSGSMKTKASVTELMSRKV